MRILQIVPEMNMGGVETGTLDMALALKHQGHEVFVISHGGVLVSRLVEAGIMHALLPVHRKEPFTILCMAWHVHWFAKRHNVDIVHARSRVPGWIAYLATRWGRAKFITTAHGAYRQHLGSRVMGWAERVIVPSTALFDIMQSQFGVPASKLRRIPRGVDLERFRALRRTRISNEGPIVAAVVGRITALKGHEVFLRAVALAHAKNPRIKGRIVGDCPADRPALKEKLVALCGVLGLEQCVDFEPSRPDVEKVYAAVDILVMPSLVPESFGRVLIEAQASGIPVVASALGGALDIIEDGCTGCLFPVGDQEALARVLLELASDSQRAHRMSEAAMEKLLKEFAVEKMVESTLAVYREVLDARNILVMKFGSMGDVLLCEPSLAALKKRFPQSRLSVLVKTPYLDVLKHYPYVDALIEYDKNGAHRGPGVALLAMDIAERKFDLCVDLQNSWRSHWLAWMARIPWRVGYARKGGRMLCNDSADGVAEKMNPVAHQFQLLKRLDIAVASQSLHFYGEGGDERWADDFLKKCGIVNGQRLAAVHVGGSSRWQSKQWGLDSFAALVNRMAAKTGLRPLLVGGPDDEKLIREIRPMLRESYVDAVGQTTLSRLAALFKRCSVIVGADSAPLHVACAVGLPFVALFGPTDPQRHAPMGPGVQGKFLFKNPPCGPCYRPICPEGHHRCMKDISLGEVLEAIASVARGLPTGNPVILSDAKDLDRQSRSFVADAPQDDITRPLSS